MQKFSNYLLPFASALALIWAGLSLGGNIIAAPAKFQVESLSQLDLLLVGRAQFAWTGIAEMILAAILLGIFVFLRMKPSIFLILAILLFAIQQFGLQPLLQARTDLRLAGEAVGSSHLHLVFIIAEVLKFGLLVWGGNRLIAERS